MEAVFLKLVSMSLSASWVILIVVVLRYVLMDAPKSLRCVLWALVAFRLVCPVSLESGLSLMPESVSTGEVVSDWADDYSGDIHVYFDVTQEYQTAVEAGREPVEAGEDGGYYVVTGEDGVSAPATVATTRVPVYSFVWLTGMTGMLAYAVFSYLRLRKRVAPSALVGKGVYLCDYIDSPFVLGVLRPRIYLPSSLEPDNAEYVLAHERAHIRRRDHWWKPLGYVLLAVHWFNPLVWLSYILLCRDIELACDERVIRDMGTSDRKAYTEALFQCGIPRRMIAACPLAFGEVGVKERVQNVLNFKKPAFWLVALAVVACIAVGVCFLTDPKTEEPERDLSSGHLEVAQLLGTENIVVFDTIDYGNARFEGIGYDGKAAVAYYEKRSGVYELIDVQTCDTSSDAAIFTNNEMYVQIHAITDPDIIGVKWTNGYDGLVLLPERPALVMTDLQRILDETGSLVLGRIYLYGKSYSLDGSGTYFTDENGELIYHMSESGTVTELENTDLEFWPDPAKNPLKKYWDVSAEQIASVRVISREGIVTLSREKDLEEVLAALNDLLIGANPMSGQAVEGNADENGWHYNQLMITTGDWEHTLYFSADYSVMWAEDAAGRTLPYVVNNPAGIEAFFADKTNTVEGYASAGEAFASTEEPWNWAKGIRMAAVEDVTVWQTGGSYAMSSSRFEELIGSLNEIPQESFSKGYMLEELGYNSLYDYYKQESGLSVVVADGANDLAVVIRFHGETAEIVLSEGKEKAFGEYASSGDANARVWVIYDTPLINWLKELQEHPINVLTFAGAEYEWQETPLNVSYGDLGISMYLPVGWIYETVEYTQEEGSFGIRCRPNGEGEGWIYFSAWPQGYTSEEENRLYSQTYLDEMEGRYSFPDSVVNSEEWIWSCVCYEGEKGDYAIINDGADGWLLEYQDVIGDMISLGEFRN